jgi:hypothetical protein
MNPRTDKSFQFAQDTTKQLMTLSTGIIALTITFSRDVVKNPSVSGHSLLLWALGAFLFSTVCGVVTLMALTGNLVGAADDKEPSIYARDVRIPSMLQALSFAAALALTLLYGLSSN